MIFSSNIFLFSFLPLFLSIYYLTNDKYKNLVILAASYAFYAWWRIDFLLLFIVVTGFNYYIGLNISTTVKKLFWLRIGVVGNLLVLAYFKYANFGVDSFNTVLTTVGIAPFNLVNIILPIGISFYIFQSISYIVDVYRKDAPATKNIIDFAAFVALFPQLIAGPVLRYKDLVGQFKCRQHSLAKFGQGCSWFMIGFIKKVFIADSLAPIVDTSFAVASPDLIEAWTAAFAYTAQLYFDFSGYSDMAIGLGLMMGFRFINNFNQPYISQSITEFWRRWHISLSSWLRDYLYIPLGGNRKGTIKTYRNLFLTMLLGGLWHGANWTFLLWGAWHGAWLALEKKLKLGRYKSFNPVAWLFTLFIVILGWVMFRANSVSEALSLYKAMFGFNGLSSQSAIALDSIQTSVLVLAYVTIVIAGFLPKLKRKVQVKWSRIASYMLVPLFAISVLKLSAQSYSPFLYFQF
ncbi:MBOAT family protein [Parashewanella spongiae]|uniref:Probable alginate O-acetylase n=1 Tax=Parashewanella spongiae TaxID=342950 RepID=A0A3A6TGL1_9GAMM|nr:MBOAT family protein [Parashewanella spongiae]MCL1079025.1 MBOAT family protein [Parashewanella spongiae]RJY10958.1 MBOAT family protein [Parashewanella spongiae]